MAARPSRYPACMRLGISLGLAVVCGLLGSACKSESTPPIYLDAEYQVRCLDCEQHATDDPAREVSRIGGELDTKITCSVSKIDGERSLNLLLDYNPGRESSRYGLRITRGLIDSAEQDDECTVRINEGQNNYEGACSGEDPTESLPCKVTFETEGEIISGTVYCDKIANPSNLVSDRYVVQPGTRDKPAKFEVHNCPGL